MPFLPEGGTCCQYRTFIFKSKNPEEVIIGHTPDCNIPQSLLDYGHSQFFAVYPNGPFEDSHPVMETTSNPPMLRLTPKWADDGKPIYWYVDLKEKNVKDLLHPLAAQNYEKAKGNDAEKSDDKKEGRTSDGEKKYIEKATQTDEKQQADEKQRQGDGENKKFHHTRVYNADSEDVTGSGPRPRRTTKGEDKLRPQLQPLRICPYHGEENFEVEDPEWYDRQQRRSEHDHLAMDSATTLVARPSQSYDPRSPRESRHHVRSHLRPLNASNYRPPRVELHQEDRDPNTGTAQHTGGLRGDALPTRADDISDDGETIVFSERDCRCVKYVVRGYGQPLEPVRTRYQVLCERHDSNLQSRQARELWAEKDMKFMSLRGGASQANASQANASQANASQAKAAEETRKREVSMEIEMMGGGYDAPVFAAVYENMPEDKSERTGAPDAPTSTATTTDNGNGQSTSMRLRGGGMNDADDGSEASADTWPTESTSLSELFDRAKEIKTRFENSGPKMRRPAPAEGRNRLRATSSIEALENPYGAAGPSTSSGCERCVNLSQKRLKRWDDQEIRKTIKEMQRDSKSNGIRSDKAQVLKRELEDKEEMLKAKEKSLNRESKALADAKAAFMKNGNTFKRSTSSRGDLEVEPIKSGPHSVEASTTAPTDTRGKVNSVSRLRAGASTAYKPTTFNGARARRISPTETRDPLSVQPEQVGMNKDDFEEAKAYQLVLDYQQQQAQDQEEDFDSGWYWMQVFQNQHYDSHGAIHSLRERLTTLQEEREMLRVRCFEPERSNQPSTYYGPPYPAARFGPVAPAFQQQRGQIPRSPHPNAMWQDGGTPGPSNFPAPPYYGYPTYPQPNIMSYQPSQSLAPAPVMTAFPMYRGFGASFKPQPSQQLLADGGPDPEEFISSRQQRQSSESRETQPEATASERRDKKEEGRDQSQTWDAQSLKEAEQEDAVEQKKQEKDEEEEREAQKQARDRWMGGQY